MISEARFANTRNWAVSRLGELSGAEVIVAAIDQRNELLGLLIDLVDIEGPLPGNAEWAQKVKAVLAKVRGES